MISTVVCLNLLISSQGGLPEMDNKNDRNIAIEQHESENLHKQKSSSGLQHMTSHESDRAQKTSKKFEPRHTFNTGTKYTPKSRSD